ncbi:CPBP family intramembrane glutamic endopeptidase [Prochlorococcus marinus]|uniref:CPBP family intramembrane glutamic endopeptidase n=1 Tax=Prochlorococcus marinus TaxID=1219 RepID=UPI0022B50D1E|nr:type II CAAX endopeptidase family protein [Prochlorococcus marinus]
MQWLPSATLFFFLYPAGWLISHLSYLFNRDISSSDLSIIGTIITFIFFLSILPSWGRIRWKTNNLWELLGLDFKNKYTALKIFCSGFIFSVFLLFILVVFFLLCGWVDGFGYVTFADLLNAIFLIVGIVFAEEIVFRGWLMEEMVLLLGLRRGVIVQSIIFSLAHYRSDIGLLALIPFLIGLFLFGLVLTLRRTIDRGSLLGCIGLHGGLVGIWYLFDSGMLVFSIHTPYFLLGPSQNMVNPIGSVIGILILLITIFFQRRVFARTGRFLASTVNASFKDETP